jgi:hypothetical protein
MNQYNIILTEKTICNLIKTEELTELEVESIVRQAISNKSVSIIYAFLNNGKYNLIKNYVTIDFLLKNLEYIKSDQRMIIFNDIKCSGFRVTFKQIYDNLRYFNLIMYLNPEIIDTKDEYQVDYIRKIIYILRQDNTVLLNFLKLVRRAGLLIDTFDNNTILFCIGYSYINNNNKTIKVDIDPKVFKFLYGCGIDFTVKRNGKTFMVYHKYI